MLLFLRNLIYIFILQINLLSIVKCDPLLLTPFIESQQLDEAKRLSAVQKLPNAPHVESYSGYFTVNEQYNSNIFFWFFPAIKNAESTPLLVWLQGGPASSSMFAVFNENGPYIVDKDIKISLNKYSWTQEFSMLYIDNPVGTGFSYTNDEKGFSRDQQNIADNLYEALQQFFTLFSEYRNNEFYITGESYAGKYIPAIGYKLHSMRNISNINFKGIAIGNGWIDPITQLDIGSFLRTIGLIDEKQLQHFYYIQNKTSLEILKENYTNANILYSTLIPSDLTNEMSYFENVTGLEQVLNYLLTESPVDFSYYSKYLKANETLKALHVGNIPYNWFNSTVNKYLSGDIFKSVKPWFTTLINEYKVLIYSGNLDIIVALPLTENFLKKLIWKNSIGFHSSERKVWKVLNTDIEIAGYVKQYENFTQVIVRNAGHVVPYDQPRVTLDMIKRFINSQPFK